MRMTKNRKAVLELLWDPPCDQESHPAMSASCLSGYLEDSKTPIHPKSIHRILRELWEAGLVVAYRENRDGHRNTLPYWELQFEPAEHSMLNYRWERIDALNLFIICRVKGLNNFEKGGINEWEPGDREWVRREVESLKLGGTADLGYLLTWEEDEKKSKVATLSCNDIELRKIIQANHPDRPGGDPELARLAIAELSSRKRNKAA